MKQKCKICGVIEGSTPDMCDQCFSSINAIDTIQRLLYTFKDDRDGAALAKVVEKLALVDRDKITNKIIGVRFTKGENGERIPGLMHAPYVSKYTDKYFVVGGLLKFMIDMIGLQKVETDEYLKLLMVEVIPHASLYQYLDPNGQGKPFKRLPGRQVPGMKALEAFAWSNVGLTDDVVRFAIDDRELIMGIGAEVIANMIILLRT